MKLFLSGPGRHKKPSGLFVEAIGIVRDSRARKVEFVSSASYQDDVGAFRDATYAFILPEGTTRYQDSLGRWRDAVRLSFTRDVPPDNGGGDPEPEPIVTGYDHVLGSGDRTELINVTSGGHSFFGTLANLVNGVTNSGGIFAFTSPNTGAYVRFEFPEPVVIDEFRSYQSGAAAYGNHKWQGSSNGTDWEDIGDEFDWGGGSSPFVGTSMAGNQKAYKFYQAIGRGNNWGATDIYEIEFKVGIP